MAPEHTSATLAFNNWAREANWPAVCDPGLNFSASALRHLLTIWREQAGDAPMPHRSRLTARLMKPYLGDISIIERVSADPVRYRVRLMGTRLTGVLGEMQGRYLDETLAPAVLPHWQRRLGLTLAENRPMRFVSRVDLKGKTYLVSENLWAPLAGDDASCPLVLMAAILKYNDVPCEPADDLTGAV
jgi:hypothetical protein